LNTRILKIDELNINADYVKQASNVLLNDGVVAFPTETVYGLGALASSSEAINKIYQIKGRPNDNPLIVHISSLEQLETIAYKNKFFDILSYNFWPGPLTIILTKKNTVLDIVSANLPTVAVRMPSNKIALELINFCKVPIVAPSANTSGKPSTTKASHVLDDLDGYVDIIIDGGSSEFGLESTIIDITSNIPIVLRPGSITLESLKNVLPNTVYNNEIKNIDKPIAPGMKYKHYSPNAEVFIVDGNLDFIVSKIKNLYKKHCSEGKKVGILSTDETACYYQYNNVLSLGSRYDTKQIASNLFDLLRKFDKIGVDIILAESLDSKGLGYSIMNRLVKSAGFKIIKI